jgi:hypothetical protein
LKSEEGIRFLCNLTTKIRSDFGNEALQTSEYVVVETLLPNVWHTYQQHHLPERFPNARSQSPAAGPWPILVLQGQVLCDTAVDFLPPLFCSDAVKEPGLPIVSGWAVCHFLRDLHFRTFNLEGRQSSAPYSGGDVAPLLLLLAFFGVRSWAGF